MSFFPKNFVHPENFNTIPWKEWNCLYIHSLALRLQEVICLIENIYRTVPDLHSFDLRPRSLFVLEEKHPEISSYLSKGNILPVNYLVNLKMKDEKGNYIEHPKIGEFNNLLNEYGLPLLKKFLGNRFSKIKRRERYDTYKSIVFFMAPFINVINSWQWGPRIKQEQIGWVTLKEDMISSLSSHSLILDAAKLPICYANWQHIKSIKNDYDLYIGFYEKTLEAEDLHRRYFIWQIEKIFKDMPNIRKIVLRDPWRDLRRTNLSYGKSFHFKVETKYNDLSGFKAETILSQWADAPLITNIRNINKIGINKAVLPLMRKEAIVIEGNTLNKRMDGYSKLINNIDPLYDRIFDKRFLILLDNI